MIDFDDPLTGALFDRTTEQRVQHTRLCLRIRRENPTLPVIEISRQADERMFAEFGIDLELLADRSLPAATTGVSFAQEEELRSQAIAHVRSEIEELHQKLPLPMLDRLGSA